MQEMFVFRYKCDTLLWICQTNYKNWFGLDHATNSVILLPLHPGSVMHKNPKRHKVICGMRL